MRRAPPRPLHLKQPSVLFHQRVLWFEQNALESRLVEIFEGGEHLQAPNEFRNQAVLQQVLRLDLPEPMLRWAGPATLAPKPIAARSRAEMILSRPEKAPPQTNKISVLSTCRNSNWR